MYLTKEYVKNNSSRLATCCNIFQTKNHCHDWTWTSLVLKYQLCRRVQTAQWTLLFTELMEGRQWGPWHFGRKTATIWDFVAQIRQNPSLSLAATNRRLQSKVWNHWPRECSDHCNFIHSIQMMDLFVLFSFLHKAVRLPWATQSLLLRSLYLARKKVSTCNVIRQTGDLASVKARPRLELEFYFPIPH